MILMIELLGTIVFAISGALVGIQKKMDVFGVVTLAMCTATGGGIIRDVILNIAPPTTFCNPLYAMLALVTGIIVFFFVRQSFQLSKRNFYHSLYFGVDAVGLGLFTAVGVETAFNHVAEPTKFLTVFIGVTTGVGGGVLRDVLAGKTPSIFTDNFYATALLAGALVCTLCWSQVGSVESMLLGATVTIVLRLFALRYQWSLPKVE